MSDMVSCEVHAMVRTTQGTIPAGSKAGLPRDEAERLERAGHLRIVDEGERDGPPSQTNDSDGVEVPEDYHRLQSVAADIRDRTGIDPADYKKATLTEYVKKHGQ